MQLPQNGSPFSLLFFKKIFNFGGYEEKLENMTGVKLMQVYLPETQGTSTLQG